MAGHDMEKFAKLSTRLWQNEKVRVFAMEHPSAFSVWTFAISYCAGELNDGELSRFHLKCLLGASDEDIDALIDAHLLDEHEDGTLWLHDFVAAQGRSRADVEEAKAKKAEAGRKGGAASGKSRNVKQDSSKTKQTRSTNEADVKQDSSKTKPDTDTDTDTDKNSSNEEFSLPPNPLASRGGRRERRRGLSHRVRAVLGNLSAQDRQTQGVFGLAEGATENQQHVPARQGQPVCGGPEP